MYHVMKGEALKSVRSHANNERTDPYLLKGSPYIEIKNEIIKILNQNNKSFDLQPLSM
jgi:hypothetical protein